MSRTGSTGTTLLTGATVLVVALAAAALFLPLFTCPRCRGEAAAIRGCQLNAGRTPTFTACGTCDDRGAVSPLRRLRLSSAAR